MYPDISGKCLRNMNAVDEIIQREQARLTRRSFARREDRITDAEREWDAELHYSRLPDSYVDDELEKLKGCM